ncbi:MAG: hypothetical protein J6S96_01450 [Muribaculaceae bacterium]|nr:hypothetical protein [Muribaculaceae bacterium]
MKTKIILICLMLMTIAGTACGQKSGRSWLSNYGIDPNNDCPIFTKPTHTGPDRKPGAGICTNDGAAYNRTFYSLGEEWHYEPKLNLCKQEEDVITSVTGILQPREILKYGVNPLPNGGALVAYRIFSNNDFAKHFFATYSKDGELLDAIAFGTREDLNNVLKAEPHGHYELYENMGGSSIKIDKDMSMTLSRYHFYKNPDKGSNDQWNDTLSYQITPEGLFVLKSHTEKDKPAVNKTAEQAMNLSMLPLSDKNAIEKWNDLVAANIKNDKAYETIFPYILPLFVSRTHEFMTWTFQNPKKSQLIGALRKAIAADADANYNIQNYIIDMIETCPDDGARNYWKSLREF